MKKCTNLIQSPNGDKNCCLEDEATMKIEGTDVTLLDLRECPCKGDMQRCLDQLITLNRSGKLWQDIPHPKKWFDDPEKLKKIKEHLQEYNGLEWFNDSSTDFIKRVVRHFKKKGITADLGVTLSDLEAILKKREEEKLKKKAEKA